MKILKSCFLEHPVCLYISWSIKFKTGDERVPIHTYILGPSTVSESKFYAGLDNGGDLAEGITCLGNYYTLQLILSNFYSHSAKCIFLDLICLNGIL